MSEEIIFLKQFSEKISEISNWYIEKYPIQNLWDIEKEIHVDFEQTHEEHLFQLNNFPNFSTYPYKNKYKRSFMVIKHIFSNEKFSKNEKITMLKKLDLSLEKSIFGYKNHISEERDKIYRETCEEFSINFDYLSNLDNDNEEACEIINRALNENKLYLWFKDFADMLNQNDKEVTLVRNNLQEIITDLISIETIKPKRLPKQTKYSLSHTVYIFDLLRDVELISSSVTNKVISESIQDLTGFSSKQAINQFGENANQEVYEKLKSETIELLEKILNRLR
jgi:hypothetical protein